MSLQGNGWQNEFTGEALHFLSGGHVAGLLLLLLHLVGGGDHRLLVDFTLGRLASGLARLLVLVLAFPLGALAGAGVHTALVVVAQANTCAHGGAGVAEPRPDAGLLPFQ